MANLIDALRQKLRIWLSLPETKNTFYVGITSLAADRDRLAYSRWVGRGQSSLIAPILMVLIYMVRSQAERTLQKMDAGVFTLTEGFAKAERSLQ